MAKRARFSDERGIPAALAIAVVIVAYIAFRIFGRAFPPIDPAFVKLALWLGLPFAVVLMQRGSLADLGLKGPMARALLPGVAALVAAGGTLLYLGARLPETIPFAALALTAVVGPFAEEALFRGYLVNRLIAAGLGNWPAIIVGALLFGVFHLGNVMHAPLETIALEIGITAAGGVLFGWTLLRFEGALWAPFAFHAGLNLAWDLFGVDATAIGGASGNIARAAGIAAGVAATIALTRRFRPAV